MALVCRAQDTPKASVAVVTAEEPGLTALCIRIGRSDGTVLELLLSRLARTVPLRDVARLFEYAFRGSPCSCGQPVPESAVWRWVPNSVRSLATYNEETWRFAVDARAVPNGGTRKSLGYCSVNLTHWLRRGAGAGPDAVSRMLRHDIADSCSWRQGRFGLRVSAGELWPPCSRIVTIPFSAVGSLRYCSCLRMALRAYGR